MSRAPYYSDLSDSQIITVPDGCEMQAVTDALTAILDRYETLRTRYSIAHDGTPQQIVVADGTLRVQVRECNGDSDVGTLAANVKEEFNRLPFTLPETSVRAAVVTSNGTPKFVVLCVFAVAMDCHGMVFLLDEFKSLMSGTVTFKADPLERMTHPVDRALEEQSTEGKERSVRGVRFWEPELAKFPEAAFPKTERPPENPRYKTFAMRSAAVRLATLELADELRVSTSSAILAMAASLLGRSDERETLGIIIAASNRYDTESMRYRGALVQGVPVAIKAIGDSPRELIPKVHRASMLAALAGHCHPDDLNVMLRKSYGDTTLKKLDCVVNLDLPAAPVTTKTSGAGVTRADAERLLDESRYDFVEGTHVENEPFYLAAHGNETDFHITLRADTTVLASADIVHFLRDLERSLLDCLPNSVSRPRIHRKAERKP